MSAAVVKLPTAAPRKVVNNRWKEQRRGNAAMRKEQGDRFNYLWPETRAVMREVEPMADFMLSNEFTAERRLLVAIVKALDPDLQRSVAANAASDASAAMLVKLATADNLTVFHIQRVLEDRGLI